MPFRLVCIVSGQDIYTEAVVVKGASVPGRKVGKDLCENAGNSDAFLAVPRKKSPLAFSQARDNRSRKGEGRG